MKKALFVCAVIFIVNHNAFSLNEERKFTIQTSPFLLFGDVFLNDRDDSVFAMDLESQYRITKTFNMSVTFSALLQNYTGDSYSSCDENAMQFKLKPMFIHRPFHTGLGGFFTGFYPSIGFLYVQDKDKNEEQLYTEAGFGFNLGYKIIFRKGFTMQIGHGIGKTFSFPKKDRRIPPINSDGSISLANTNLHLLDFKLGYSW